MQNLQDILNQLSISYFINVKSSLLMYGFIYFHNLCNLFYLFVLAFKNGISFPISFSVPACFVCAFLKYIDFPI